MVCVVIKKAVGTRKTRGGSEMKKKRKRNFGAGGCRIYRCRTPSLSHAFENMLTSDLSHAWLVCNVCSVGLEHFVSYLRRLLTLEN
jgi:hypothetical protein